MTDSRFLYLILDGAHSGAFNMQMDEALFRRAIRDQSADATLRFYRFSEPCWTIGYGVWKSAPVPGGTAAVRRITGGGIVKHGEDLTFALIAPYTREEPLGRVRKSYFLIHEALRRAFREFGLTTERYTAACGWGTFCFDSPVANDLMFEGKKAAGGAQKRSGGYVLHQGSIDWPFFLKRRPDLDEAAFARAFARVLGNWLGLWVKESPFPAENKEDTELAAWTRHS